MAKRTCSVEGCGEPHRYNGFCKSHARRDYYRRNKARERAQHDAWRKANVEHDAARKAAWYRANAEQVKARRRAKYAANPEAGREYSRRWRAENPELAREVELKHRQTEAFRLRNRENGRRRYRGPEGIVDYALILAHDGMVCHICDGVIDSVDDLHFDHVVPLSRGGEHVASNIAPSHAACNLRKGTRLMEELGDSL